MASTVLKVENIVKEFKNFRAVNSVSFEVPEGQILGLLGPNGAGKTTLIAMLLGILIPTSGTILVFEKNFKNHREDILSQVNFSSTYISMPLSLTVKENLTFFARLYHVPDY
ncbi:MAG: ATP-binding cassette domain-containing protein, partial [Nitrospiria bacterium]